MIYRFEQRARRPRTLVILGLVWFAILCLLIVLEMAIWIAGVLFAFTLPLVIDLIRNAASVIEVWPNRVKWSSGLNSGNRNDIDHVRLNRRFDGSMKITLIHVGGAQTRLPPDVTPPTDALEDALKRAGLPTERHPFSLL